MNKKLKRNKASIDYNAIIYWYFVGSPLFFIAASILLGIDIVQVSCLTSFQSCLSPNLCLEDQHDSSQLRFIISQRFLKIRGLKSPLKDIKKLGMNNFIVANFVAFTVCLVSDRYHVGKCTFDLKSDPPHLATFCSARFPSIGP